MVLRRVLAPRIDFGAQVKPEQAFCEVESVKAVSDVYAPVYGTQTIYPEGTPYTHSTTTQRQIGLYLQDQVKLDNWVLTIGGFVRVIDRRYSTCFSSFVRS